MSDSAPRLSVIVPATDGPVTLARCLAAIEPQLGPDDELIAVEQCAAPGPAAARNQGAARSAGEVLVFVDADVMVADDALDRIRSSFAAWPGLAAVFGAYDESPEAPGTVSRFRNLLHHHVHSSAAGEVSTFWAGLGAITAEAFSRSGGFDDVRYRRPSIEDIELGSRISAAGGRIVLDPQLRGTHAKRWTLRAMIATDLHDRGAPWVELLIANRGAGAGQLNLGWRYRLSALAALAAAAALLMRLPGRLLLALASLVALNRSFYSLLHRRLGLVGAVAGIGLHVVHQLVAVAAVLLGLARSLHRRRDGRA